MRDDRLVDELVGLPVEQIFEQAPSMRHPEWVTRLGETFTAERPASGAYTIFDRQGQLVYS
jgi:hypothetical protein